MGKDNTFKVYIKYYNIGDKTLIEPKNIEPLIKNGKPCLDVETITEMRVNEYSWRKIGKLHNVSGSYARVWYLRTVLKEWNTAAKKILLPNKELLFQHVNNLSFPENKNEFDNSLAVIRWFLEDLYNEIS